MVNKKTTIQKLGILAFVFIIYYLLFIILPATPASAADFTILPKPGATCQDEECRKKICPRICQKQTALGPFREGCDPDNNQDYLQYYCNHGICLPDVKNAGPNDPRITAPGALPCNYTLDDMVYTGIRLSQFIFGIVGGLFLLLIVYGGFQYLTALGNPETLQAAKKTLTAAFIGLIIIFGATIFVRFLGSMILPEPGEKGAYIPEGAEGGLPKIEIRE